MKNGNYIIGIKTINGISGLDQFPLGTLNEEIYLAMQMQHKEWKSIYILIFGIPGKAVNGISRIGNNLLSDMLNEKKGFST